MGGANPLGGRAKVRLEAMSSSSSTAILLITIGYCAVLGLCVGSFLNVVVYRVPRNLSVVRPRSACPGCQTPIADRDNIPVLSWLLLRGRCRTCATRISARYPSVELAGGALFAATAWRIGPHWTLAGFLFANAALLALALIDCDHMLLPRSIVLPTVAVTALWLTLSAAVAHQWPHWEMAALCSVAWGLTFFALHTASPRVLGYGDIRLAYLLGAVLGWFGWSSVLLAFFLANLIGAVVGIGLMVAKKASREQAVPYGVFLNAGAFVVFFEGRWLLALFPHVTFN